MTGATFPLLSTFIGGFFGRKPYTMVTVDGAILAASLVYDETRRASDYCA